MAGIAKISVKDKKRGVSPFFALFRTLSSPAYKSTFRCLMRSGMSEIAAIQDWDSLRMTYSGSRPSQLSAYTLLFSIRLSAECIPISHVAIRPKFPPSMALCQLPIFRTGLKYTKSPCSHQPIFGTIR